MLSHAICLFSKKEFKFIYFLHNIINSRSLLSRKLYMVCVCVFLNCTRTYARGSKLVYY